MDTTLDTFSPLATPTTPRERLKLAATLALATMVQRHLAHLAQNGEAPVIVVAVDDSDIGRQFIVGNFGPKILPALTGPVVLAMSEQKFLAMFSGPDLDAARGWFADAPAGAMRCVFAVNGESLDYRTIAPPGSPAPEAVADEATADACVAAADSSAPVS